MKIVNEQQVEIFIFLLILAFIAYVFHRISIKVSTKFDSELRTYYQTLGYQVLEIEDPGFSVKNPYLADIKRSRTNEKTIVKQVALYKDDTTVIVWLKMTIKNKTIEFESKPNLEGKLPPQTK